MNWEIRVQHNYYGTNVLSFKKEFEVPFPPFIGMTFTDDKDDFENNIDFESNNYQQLYIEYLSKSNSFYISVKHIWRSPVSDDTIDSALEIFQGCGWTREDSTDLTKFKLRMKEDYEKNNK